MQKITCVKARSFWLLRKCFFSLLMTVHVSYHINSCFHMTSEASLSFTLIRSPAWQDSMSLVVTLLANEAPSHFGTLFSLKQRDIYHYYHPQFSK